MKNKIITLFLSLLLVFSALSTKLFDTSKKFTNSQGIYTAQRRDIHNKILREYQKRMLPLRKRRVPIAIFMAGGAGSGKTTALMRIADKGVIKLNDFLMIAADEIKEIIPEYDSFKKIDPVNAAAMVHIESTYLAKEVFNNAKIRKVSFILDGMLAKIDNAKLKLASVPGYQTRIIFVDTPVDIAIQRAKSRMMQTGRMVPEQDIGQSNKQARDNMEILKNYTDNIVFIENGEKLIFKKIVWKHGKVKVLDTPVELLNPNQVKEIKGILDPL